VFRFILAGTLAVIAATDTAPVQQTQVVRLTRSADGSLYRFAPGRITARPGTTIEFRAEKGAPFQVAFEPVDLDARGRGLIAAALSHPGGELRGPVLADSGSRFRMTVPSLQPGSYRFFCLTHIAYRMAGLLIVQ
jgi:plastocyanin